MSAENAVIKYESNQIEFPMEALSDSGDQTIFESQASRFSGVSGLEPVVYPDGLATGGVVSVAVSGTDNVVDVAALTCYLAGVKTSVAAGVDKAITRPGGDVANINSITIDNAGAITVVTGSDSLSTAFSETRGAAGGPPYIPVGSIEIAQVRLTTQAAAPITSSQIFRQLGKHVEKYDFPTFETVNEDGEVVFASALPASHTGDLPKGVFASYAEPVMTDGGDSSDWQAPEVSYSVSSTQIYRKTINDRTSSLSQGSFKHYSKNGIADWPAKLKGENLWFEFYPNKYSGDHQLTQGVLGVNRSYPASGSIVTDCTISPENETVDVEV